MPKKNQGEKSWAEIVVDYALYQNGFKTLSKEYDRKKSVFYKQMDQMFEETRMEVNSINSPDVRKIEYTKKSGEVFNLSVSRVQSTKVIFDADKLEAKIPKTISKKIIRKKYFIEDFSGLVEYLKNCNVDPNKFKQFLRIEKSVDENSLEQMSELGLISDEQVKQCCSISKNAPYYKVLVKRKEDEEVK